MFLKPENLRRREPGQDGIAQRADRLLHSSELLRDLVALGHSGGIAPEFGWPDDFARGIERNEAVLLSAHPYGFHLGRHRFGLAQRDANGAGRSVAPRMWMLLLCPRWQIRNQTVFLRRRRQHFPITRVHHQDLGGLRAAIDAKQERSHNSGSQTETTDTKVEERWKG